jgi:uncharacterized OB-fold protein
VTTNQVPIVEHLVLGDTPHLVAQECKECGARFFDRRNACARCGGLTFVSVPVERTGTLRTFTIVTVAAPGVPVPYVAGIVDCGGTTVRGTVINVAPRPDAVTLGMPLQLCTRSMGVDPTGSEGIAYAFEPLSTERSNL